MTLELVEQCHVCDGTEGPFETYFGLRMHEDCAPGPWREGRKDRDEFFAEIERKRNWRDG